MVKEKKAETATFAGGCFWCTEAVFQRVKGVLDVVSGFTGGTIKNPPYREVITGRTGHAEAIQIQFDPTVVSFEELVQIFFSTHDPTTLNRQQNDVGTQYRSAIFYHSDQQKETAERVRNQLDNEGIFADPIVTEIRPADHFYVAEQEHHEYYDRHRNQPYCQVIIDPKIAKLRQRFSSLLKT